ncbi:hypothetical protein HMPREF0528_0289 [Lactobacillus johnsonii ATCC 33200]|jgi:PTS system cellobiose-specific IIC component|uniref:Uncharacterized protein n=1 Tax=Lactobacillus johnsonii ATCC 33200 TaxID=525330 RepID=C2E3G5_LACJH|nr:hypothetical protein HMPREF0528_0289 [Lactobacillus johnsonii ATCC 33200]KRK55379.1 hypothetical protein FC22_GL000759 [Lactobacillus johnsonii ATCC 33200]
MLQTLTIDGGMSAKAVTENIDKLPHALQTFLESPVTGVFNITWLGGDGMIAAIIVGLLVGWIYSAIMKKAGLLSYLNKFQLLFLTNLLL